MIALLTLVILALFIIIGISRHKPNTNNEQFFLMSRSASTSDYEASTVAFSLQIAVTVYFIYWGFAYGWSNLWFIATWALGIYIYSKFSEPLYDLLRQKSTYFEILYDSKALRLIGIVFFTLSLVGLIYTEFYFATDFISRAIITEIPTVQISSIFWIILLFLIGTVTFYTLLGGMEKVVLTDKLQLGLGVFAIEILFAVLSPLVATNGLYVYLTLYVPIIVLLGCYVYFVRSMSRDPLGFAAGVGSSIAASLTILGFLILIISLLMNVLPALSASTIENFPKGLTYMTRTQDHGWWPIFGFGVANLIWQFGDYTAFHRLSIFDTGGEKEKSISKIKKSIQRTAWASPITWGLGIFLGMTLDATNLFSKSGFMIFSDFSNYFLSLAVDGDFGAMVLVLSFTLFFISVLLSTVDSGIIGLGKMWISDSLLQTESLKSRKFVLLVIGMLLFVMGLIHSYLEIDVLIALNVFYAWGLVFGPPFLFRLLRVNVSQFAMILAPIIGASVATYNVVNPFELPSLVALVFPSMSGILTSLLIVIIGALLTPSEKKIEMGVESKES